MIGWLVNDPPSEAYGNFTPSTADTPVESTCSTVLEPVNFTGTASYITGKRSQARPRAHSGDAGGNFFPDSAGITSTPKATSGYQQEKEIDEFDSTGIFIRRINAKTTAIPAAETRGAEGVRRLPRPYRGRGRPDQRQRPRLRSGALVMREFSAAGEFISHINGAETPAGRFGFICNSFACFDSVFGVAVDSKGYAYVTDGEDHVVHIFRPQPRSRTSPTNPTRTRRRRPGR